MIFEKRFLSAPLDTFIEYLWYWEGDAPAHTKEAITASRNPSILIDLSDNDCVWYDGDNYARRNKLKGISISGTQTSPFAINAHQPKIMGVQFKPGGGYPFLGPAARAFHGTHVSLEDVWGPDAERLHQRIFQAPTIGDKFDILFDGLIKVAPREFVQHPAVALALQRFENCPHRSSVAATARDAEVSQKKFIRLFTDEVGMTPKLFLRVARFQRVVERIQFAPHINWGDVVERHGYYDQSHFIRDFKEFSGFAPTEWLKVRGPYSHHIPLPA